MNERTATVDFSEDTQNTNAVDLNGSQIQWIGHPAAFDGTQFVVQVYDFSQAAWRDLQDAGGNLLTLTFVADRATYFAPDTGGPQTTHLRRVRIRTVTPQTADRVFVICTN